MAGGGNLQNRQGRPGLGPVPGPQLQRDLPTHRAGRPRPATSRRDRWALAGNIQLPDTNGDSVPESHPPDSLINDADLTIPLGDAPVPDHGGKPWPPGIAAIKLSIAETTR